MRSIVIAIVILASFSCASKKVVTSKPETIPNIIGFWKGCDERVIAFIQENDSIYGICKELGGLAEYGFEEDEVGYKVVVKENGVYQGKVKWRYKDKPNASWKNVEIKIDNNSYSDKGSDRCGANMNRVTNLN